LALATKLIACAPVRVAALDALPVGAADLEVAVAVLVRLAMRAALVEDAIGDDENGEQAGGERGDGEGLHATIIAMSFASAHAARSLS
jgi:hypothetical protein